MARARAAVSGPVGAWAKWYDAAQERQPYADTVTYRIAADWLAGLAVEDWGCGYGWFSLLHDGPYLGVDGTVSPWCDVVDDLVTRRSSTPGLLLRHVLEHNVHWREVLANAVGSATVRLVVVGFLPDGDGSVVGWTQDLGVPDVAVPHDAVDEALTAAGWVFTRRTLSTPSALGTETVWLAERG